MKKLIDILNVNAEASCLSSTVWLSSLKGKKESPFYTWLNLYVRHQKKITLGLTGSTVVDLAQCNPEAIQLINLHPDIFEVILRPFSHDIALLRTEEGFEQNVSLGKKIIQKEFKKVSPFFLPPEFMLTNEQITLLKHKNVEAVFINSSRFPDEIRDRVPTTPYIVQGVNNTPLGCIPVEGGLTYDYLSSLHTYSSAKWNSRIKNIKNTTCFAWRDGESPFLIPEGIHREELWLKNEDRNIQRTHLRDLKLRYVANHQLSVSAYKSYPIHSFSAWMQGFRMLGFIKRIERIEEKVTKLTKEQLILWLHAIGSDILSAVEKKSPIIKIKTHPRGQKYARYIIQRSERGFEGEEYLYLLEQSLKKKTRPPFTPHADQAHIVKLINKLRYFKKSKY